MVSRGWREGSTAEWRRKARCAFPARIFETARSQRRVRDGGDGGRGHGAVGEWGRRRRNYPWAPIYKPRAVTAHYRAVTGEAWDRVWAEERLRGWWPHDRPHRGPQNGNRQPRIFCAGQRENRGVVGGQVGLALECAGALFGGSG